MSHQEKVSLGLDCILTFVGVTTGAASTLDNIEQIGRILPICSIVSTNSSCSLLTTLLFLHYSE